MYQHHSTTKLIGPHDMRIRIIIDYVFPRLLSVFVIAFFLFTAEKAEAGMIQGIIYKNNLPLVSSSLRITNTDVEIMTDGNGNYRVFLPPGSYVIEHTDSSGTVYFANIKSFHGSQQLNIYLRQRD